jgi:tetratricopeptide (TPR) repeat protein
VCQAAEESYSGHLMVDASEIVHRIEATETSIEDAMWTSVEDENHERALQEYEQAKKVLESIETPTDRIEKERKRVLSYCLMRITDALETLGKSEGSIERAEESLKLALESENRVQILRSKLALGVTLINSGQWQEAESHFTEIILQTQDETEDNDIIQVYGWTLIVRVNILLGKSLYNQAKELANQALGVLSEINNYAGLRTTCSLLSQIYEIEGDTEEAESYRSRSEEYATLAREHRQ